MFRTEDEHRALNRQLIGLMERHGIEVDSYMTADGDQDLRAQQIVSAINDSMSAREAACINSRGRNLRGAGTFTPLLRELIVADGPDYWTLNPLGEYVYEHMPSIA